MVSRHTPGHFFALIIAVLVALVSIFYQAPGISYATTAQTDRAQVQYITLTWKGFSGVFTWDFPYNDDFFYQDPATYSHQLCQSSFGLTVSAFRNAYLTLEEQGRTAVKYLSEAGFTDIETYGYNMTPGTDTVSYVIGHKTLDGFDLVVVGICGSGYQNEWASNVTLGNGERHQGFNRSAALIGLSLSEYLDKYGIEDAKLWTSGFSRAGAISNILAADCIDSGRFQAVYGYSFAAPRTTTAPGDPGHYTLFNVVGKLDVVPSVPFAEYGYSRYGTDLYRLALEADSTYVERFAEANAVCLSLTGSELYTSVESNAVLRTLVGYLLAAVPSPSEFAEVLQPALRQMWSSGEDSQSTLDSFLAAVQTIEASSPEQQQAVENLENYLINVLMANIQDGADELDTATIHGDSVAIDTASDPFFANTSTLFHEHWPELYMCWLFSSDDPADVLNNHLRYSYIAFSGTDFYVDVLDDGKLVERVYSNGRVTVDAEDVGDGVELAETVQRIPASVTGNQVILTIPRDRAYEIEIGSDISQDIDVLSLLCTAGHAQMQIEQNDTIPVGGSQRASVALSSLETDSNQGEASIDNNEPDGESWYSEPTVARSSLPVTVLANFLQNGNNQLTVSQVKTIATVLIVMAVLAVVSSILLAIRRRLRGVPRSVRATIGVHAISACFFLWMSLNASLLFPKISIAGIAFDMMASMSLALMMLKAVGHSNKRLVFCLMAAVLVDAVATIYTMQDMTAANYVYTVGYLLLTMGFALTRRPGKTQLVVFAALGISATAAVVGIQQFQLGSIESQVISLLAIIAAFACSTALPGTLRIAAGLLMVPDVLDYITLLFPDMTALAGISMAVYYVALFFLAASAFILSRKGLDGGLEKEELLVETE